MRWYLPNGNPIFWNELRRRARGRRPFYLLFFLYALVAGGVPVAGLWLRYGSFDDALINSSGDETWTLFFLWQALLVWFLAPALTAGTVIGERTRHTYESLVVSRLTGLSFVLGKYFSVVVVLAVLLFGTLPMLLYVTVCCSFAPREVAVSYFVLLGTGAFTASLGLLASCQCQRLGMAYIVAYLYAAAAAIGLGIFLVPLMFSSDSIGYQLNVWLFAVLLVMLPLAYTFVFSGAEKVSCLYELPPVEFDED